MSERDFQELMLRIKSRREELGLSYQDLANLTGISKSTLQRYETGDIKNFPVGKLPDLAHALRTTEYELTGWSYPEQVQAKTAPISAEPDPLAGALFAAYGEVKEEFDEDDIADIQAFMRMVAERKRKRAEKAQGGTEE